MATPPWRVLDAAPPREQAATAAEPPSAPATVTLDASTIKLVAGGIGVAACAILAFVLAVAGSGGQAVGVEGGDMLPQDATTAGVTGSGSIQAGAEPQAEIVVEVVGAVRSPGVFRLAAGSRVADLIAAAGGFGPRVDTAASGALNLAATLADGDQIRVAGRGDPTPVATAGTTSDGQGGGTTTGGSGPIDLNRATAAELDALPGVGPATIEKIIGAREEAPFTAVDELRTRGILGEKTFEKLRELVVVS